MRTLKLFRNSCMLIIIRIDPQTYRGRGEDASPRYDAKTLHSCVTTLPWQSHNYMHVGPRKRLFWHNSSILPICYIPLAIWLDFVIISIFLLLSKKRGRSDDVIWCRSKQKLCHLVKQAQGFLRNVFFPCLTRTKTLGGPSAPSPPPLYQGGGMNLRVRHR